MTADSILASSVIQANRQNILQARQRHSLKALVTGATGFIGSHLTEALIQKGVQVRCLVRRTSDTKWLNNLPIELIYGDCNDKDNLHQAVDNVDWVFHLAGVTKAIKRETYFKVNGLGTYNLIQACLEKNPCLRKFVYISSQAAAGPSTSGSPKNELDSCEPVSNYGRSKRVGERMVLAHAQDLPVIVLRPSAVYGPRDKDLFAVFRLLSKKIDACPLNRGHRISLCHVQDIVQGILLAAEIQTKSGDIFFLSDGQGYGLGNIGSILARAMNITVYRILVPKSVMIGIAFVSEYLSKLTGKPRRINIDKSKELMQLNWVCDITKASKLLGYQPKVTLVQGAQQTYEWYRQERWL